MPNEPAIWFPAIRAGTGTDVFTENLAAQLHKRGIRAEITWLPLRAEYVPWTVSAPKPPAWANVVHVNTWLHPRFIPAHLPVVATLHHSIYDPGLRPYKGWLRSAYHQHWIASVERATMRRTDRVVAVSEFAARSAQEHLLDCSIGVIPNGVDVQRFQPPAQRQVHHPFRLLYVGSWMARKGVDLLAPVMRALGEDFELHYTGGAVAQRDGHGMPPNMHDLGRLNTQGIVAAMQDADALLFPSRSEGFGLVAAEAMACGLPVIATRGSSLTEVITDGVTGTLCAQDDTAAFAAAVRQLARDPALALAMSNAAFKHARQHLSISTAVDAYVDVYRTCTMLR